MADAERSGMDAQDGHEVGAPDGLKRGPSGGEERGASSGREILLVEDNPGDVALFQQAIDESDVRGELRVADCGDDALAILDDDLTPTASGSIDIVVLDLDLPGKSGLAVLEELKQDPGLQPIPVIVLSSSDDGREVRRAYELGANAYLVKRMRFSETLALVEALAAFWFEAAELPE